MWPHNHLVTTLQKNGHSVAHMKGLVLEKVGRMAYNVIQSDESQWPFQIFLLLPMLRALYQTILLAGIVFGIELGLLRSYKISSGWGGAVEVSCCLLLSPLTSGMLSCSL